MYNKEITVKGLNLGYKYFIDYSHPLATGNSGRVLLHRHIASIKEDRWLGSNEHVHHIDEDILNNDPTNLAVLSIEEHNQIHNHKILLVCKTCNVKYTTANNNTIYCSTKCMGIDKVKDKTLTKELLDTLIPIHSWVALGIMFGYSDSGIKKRAKALGCFIPTRNKRLS